MPKDWSHRDSIFGIGTQGAIRTETLANGGMSHQGTVATWTGYVKVDSYRSGNGVCYTYLQIIHDGALYAREFDEYFKPRTLVRIANRFAYDVFAGKVKDGGES